MKSVLKASRENASTSVRDENKKVHRQKQNPATHCYVNSFRAFACSQLIKERCSREPSFHSIADHNSVLLIPPYETAVADLLPKLRLVPRRLLCALYFCSVSNRTRYVLHEHTPSRRQHVGMCKEDGGIV